MKKFSALFVVMAFLFSMQLSVRPLNAASAQETVTAPAQSPTVVEQESGSYSVSKKKSPLPIILGVLAVGALVAVLVLVVFKTKYDITGDWQFSIHWAGNANPVVIKFTFQGDKKGGQAYVADVNLGTYTVDGKDVSISLLAGYATYVGKFTGKDTMEGTMSNIDYDNGTWTATRLSGASSVNVPMKSAGDHEGALKRK